MVAAALFLLQAASTQVAAPPEAAAIGDPSKYPFGVGESFTYAAKLGPFTLGEGRVAVDRIETYRGHESFVFEFRLAAGNRFYRLNDQLESWTGTHDMISRRLLKTLNENGDKEIRDELIYPDSGFIRQVGREKTRETVDEPLDDAAFIYFVRLLQLTPGKTYAFDRYYRANANPLLVTVVDREVMELPDGTKVPCLVLHPVMGGGKLFTEKHDARIWITDDARRIPVRIRTRQSFGTITLELKAMTLAPPPAGRG